MTQARYLLVRGVPGRLVADPHKDPAQRRFLGKKPNGVFWDEGPIDEETGKPRWPAAVPVEEVVLDHASIRKAANSGIRGDLTSPQHRGKPDHDIIIVSQCIAGSMGEAISKLTAEKPRKEK